MRASPFNIIRIFYRMVSTRPSIDELSQQIRQLEHTRAPNGRSWAVDPTQLGQDVVSSGIPQLDALLPRRGFRTGTITEWLAPSRGCGVSTLTLCVAAQCVCDDRVLAIVDFAGDFYPPAAAALGVDHRKTVVIRPNSKVDGFWALEQLLRSSAIGAIWCNLDRLASTNRSADSNSDSRLFRRLQLASEAGECVCFIVRPTSARAEPSWADLRFLASPSQNRDTVTTSVNIELLRSRDSFAQGVVTLQLPHISGLSEADCKFHSVEAVESRVSQFERWA
jgi:hypothetical protein